MKVKLGKYLNWWGPYQIMDAVFFWHEKYPSEKLAQRWDYHLHDCLSDWLAETWVADFCNWIYSKRKRTEIIKIDDYDVWSMDSTLSLIVVPMLKKLKECKHGAPHVDLADVPKHLHPTQAQQKKFKNLGDTDPEFFKRWDWVMDEMIWAHEQIISDDGDGQFYDHSLANDPKDDLNTQVRKIKVDRKGLEAYHKRIDNGLRLFGKYYRNLWD
jgi:hypothetical protein